MHVAISILYIDSFLLIKIIIKGNISKKISGKVIERMLVDNPKNKPAKARFRNNFLWYIAFIEKYINRIKKNKNTVSDNTCEDKIIIKGDKIAKVTM